MSSTKTTKIRLISITVLMMLIFAGQVIGAEQKQIIEQGENYVTYEVGGDPDNNPNTRTMETTVFLAGETTVTENEIGISHEYWRDDFEWGYVPSLLGSVFCRNVIGLCRFDVCECSIDGDGDGIRNPLVKSYKQTTTATLANWESQNSVKVKQKGRLWAGFIQASLIPVPKPVIVKSRVLIKNSSEGILRWRFSDWFIEGTCTQDDPRMFCSIPRDLDEEKNIGNLIFTPNEDGEISIDTKTHHMVWGDITDIRESLISGEKEYSGVLVPASDEGTIVVINWNQLEPAESEPPVDTLPVITAEVCGYETTTGMPNCSSVLPPETNWVKCETTYFDAEGHTANCTYTWGDTYGISTNPASVWLNISTLSALQSYDFACTYACTPRGASTLPQVTTRSNTVTRESTDPTETDLVLHLPLESDGQDVSGYNNNGTLQNGINFGSMGTCSYAELDGFEDYIEVGDDSSLDIGTAITMTAWVNPVDSTFNPIIHKLAEGGGAGGYTLEVDIIGGLDVIGRLNWGCSSCGLGGFKAGTVPTNDWTHIAFTYDGAESKIYINGELDSTSTDYSSPIGTNNINLIIGSDFLEFISNPRYFEGKMYDLRVYDGAISAGEVGNIYNTTKCAEVIEPMSCEVTQSPAQMLFGETDQIEVTCYDGPGNETSCIRMGFGYSPPELTNITSEGIDADGKAVWTIEALSPAVGGAAYFKANRSASFDCETYIEVINPDNLLTKSCTITNAPAQMSIGETQVLETTCYDGFGSAIDCEIARWGTSPTARIELTNFENDEAGRATATAEATQTGTTNITVTVTSAITCNASIEVTDTEPPVPNCETLGGACKANCSGTEEEAELTCETGTDACCFSICEEEEPLSEICSCQGTIVASGYCCEEGSQEEECTTTEPNCEEAGGTCKTSCSVGEAESGFNCTAETDVCCVSTITPEPNFVSIDVQTDKDILMKGEQVTVTVIVTREDSGFTGNLEFYVEGIGNIKPYQLLLPRETRNINFSGGETEKEFTYTIETGLYAPGGYTFTAEITSTNPLDPKQSDNRAIETIIIRPNEQVTAPEIHPILVIFVVLAVIVIIGRN